MTDTINYKCQRIMKHLLSDHPVAQFFKDPVDTDLIPEYRKVIKNPSDISTVKRRLKNKKYEKLSQWNNDVELIFKNAEKFNGSDSPITLCALQLQEAFEKLKTEYLCDVESLTKRCNKLQAKLEKLLTPNSSRDNVVPELPAFIEAARLRPSKNDSSDLENFLSSLPRLQDELEKMIESPDLKYQILSILQEEEPSSFAGENDIEVDINVLKSSTISKLREFVSSHL